MNAAATPGAEAAERRHPTWRWRAASASPLVLALGLAAAWLAALAEPSIDLAIRAVTTALGLVVVANFALQVYRRRIFAKLDPRAAWVTVLACVLYWLLTSPAGGDGSLGSAYATVGIVAGLALYPIVTWGLLRLSRARPGRLAVAIFVLDQVIVSWAAGMVLWHLFLYPAGAGGGASLPAILLLTVSPSADVGLLLLATVLVGVPMRGVTRRAKLLLIAAVIGAFGSDVFTAIHTLSPGPETQSLPVLFQAWFWITAGWITVELMAARDLSDAPVAEQLSFSWLPYAAIAIAFVVPAASGWGHLDLLEQHVPASIVLIVLVLLRLGLMARQNAALVASGAERRTEARFTALVQHGSDLIVLADRASRIRYVAPSATTILHLPPGELEARLFTDLVHSDQRSRAIALLAEIGEAAGETRMFECRLAKADGTYCEAEVAISNLLEVPEVQGLVFTVRDIGDRKALERQLTFQALHDPLTGLANRTLFADRVEHSLAGSRRWGRSVAVLYLDLDDFKRINDAHGHGTGDQLLIAVATKLASVFRAVDTVARLGGDEFGVLVEDLESADEARRLADRVAETLSVPIDLGGIEAFVSASVGIAISVGDDLDHEQLLRNADVAMYVAKANGKRRSETFDPSMHERIRDRLVLEADLRRAIERNEFEVQYQPVWATASRQMVAVEALVRWRHPARGLLPLAEFIGMAEETGLIVPIGRLVLDAACAQVAAWDRAGRACAGLSVAVNLSPRQLREADLVDMVAAALARSGLPASRLSLEITEAVLVDDNSSMSELLQRLKALGVGISIDDFGTGYSSLSYLRRLPIDTLKIAKQFVDVVANGARDEALAQAIVSLARSLDLGVVAEGVEEEAQLEVLAEMGCELGQGFLVSPPMPPERLQELAAATTSPHAA